MSGRFYKYAMKLKETIQIKDLRQLLLYLTEKGKTKKEKRPLKRKNETFTQNRMVYVFYQPEVVSYYI